MNFLNFDENVITPLCYKFIEKWKTIPNGADHSAIKATLINSISLLNDRLTKKSNNTITIGACFDVLQDDKLYIACIDIGELDEAKKHRYDKPSIYHIPSVNTLVWQIDLASGRLDRSLIPAYEDYTAFAGIIKNLSPMAAMALISCCKEPDEPSPIINLPYVNFIKNPSPPIFILKIVVDYHGIKSTISIIGEYSKFSKCAGWDIDGIHTDVEVIDKTNEIAQAFTALVICRAMNAECVEDFDAIGIDTSLINEYTEGPYKFSTTALIHTYNEMLLHYASPDNSISVDIEALVFWSV